MKTNACKFCNHMHFPPEPCAPRDQLRNGIAWDLHKLLCDGPHDDKGGPCWTAWQQEADLLMIRVEVALADAWEDGARNGSRGLLPQEVRGKRNPYLRGGGA